MYLLDTNACIKVLNNSSASLVIAATACAHDLILVSHNTREFSRVVGLKIEDWE